MGNLSIKIRRMVGAKEPPDEQRLMTWYEDALDLENACSNWEKPPCCCDPGLGRPGRCHNRLEPHHSNH